MDITAVPVVEHRQPTLASKLISAIASHVGHSDFAIDSIEATSRQSALAVEFALSGLPRRIVQRGFGEVLFNENATVTDRGGCDGALVAVLRFGGHHAVIDADRGHAEYDDDNDAYLVGVAHVLHGAPQAQAHAAQCALNRRQRACSEALRRAIELALPLPAHVAAKAVRDAMTSAIAPERTPWVHAVRYFFDRPDLEVMR